MLCLNKIRVSYMLKFGFHSAINLPEYESLAYRALNLRPLIDEPASLEGTLGFFSWSIPKWTKRLRTLLFDDAVQLYFDIILFLGI